MHVSFEGHNVDVLPEWKQHLTERLGELSDPRDPVINARCSVSYKASEIPPAESSLVVSLRGKQIVVTKRAEHVDAALKLTLDIAKREIRQFYEQRSDYRPKHPVGFEPPADEADDEGLDEET